MMIYQKSLSALTGLALMSRGSGFAALKIPASRQLSAGITRTFATKSPENPTKLVASEELLDLINSQVTNEFSASHFYLSAAIWCETRDLSGMASYMRAESAEERSHALGIIDYAQKRDFAIELEEFEAPDSDWSSVQDLWENLLRAEEMNTQALLKLADVAVACSDHATTAFLMPYHMVS